LSQNDNLYEIKRDKAGRLLEICPVNLLFKIGSFDCTKNCKFNKNTKHEIEHYGPDLPKVRCPEIVSKISQPKLDL